MQLPSACHQGERLPWHNASRHRNDHDHTLAPLLQVALPPLAASHNGDLALDVRDLGLQELDR